MDAALKIRKKLNALGSEMLPCQEDDVVIKDGVVYNRNNHAQKISFKELAKEMYQRGINPSESGFILSRRGFPDPDTGQGEPYAAYTFGCTIAEIEVDVESCAEPTVDIAGSSWSGTYECDNFGIPDDPLARQLQRSAARRS